MKYLILVALFAFASVQAQRTYPIFNRSCEERSAAVRPNVKTAFNVAAYSGTWFETQRYQQQDESEADCLASIYTWNFINRTFAISRTGHDFVADLAFRRDARAFLSFPDEDSRRGLLNVTYYADREANEVNYYVLATDYFQYAIGWGCENLEGDRSREFAWILSRTPELPATYTERVNVYIERFFDRQFLRPTVQTDAFCLNRPSPGRSQ